MVNVALQVTSGATDVTVSIRLSVRNGDATGIYVRTYSIA